MKRNKIFLFGIFILVFIVGSTVAGNITINYPEEVNVNEEFGFSLELMNFSEDIYDVKIDILCGEIRIAKIFDNSWRSTYYYLIDIIRDSEEKDFKLKVEKPCDADITVKIKNSKEKTETFTDYKIKSIQIDEELDKDKEEDSENLDNENEEDQEKEEDENYEESKEGLIKTNSSDGKTKKNANLAPIILNAQSIKSENDKEFSTENLALFGVMLFCIVFGALLFVRKRKYKNEFQ